MTLTPKQLLKYIRLADFDEHRYNVQICPKSKETKEFLSQPIWKILPNVVEYWFPPFLISKASIYAHFIENEFIMHKMNHGWLTKKLTWTNELSQVNLFFDSINDALEYLKPSKKHTGFFIFKKLVIKP